MQELIDKLFRLNENQLIETNEFVDNLLNPKKHRTLTQNAYMWQLINQIGNKLSKSKEEIYLQMLKDYGQGQIVSILSSINPVGYFKYYEEIGKGEVNGKQFTHYKIYKGSSEYNTSEMKILIDGVIMEAEQLGIPTLTENEISRMRVV